jgi:hypothetical protein
LAKPLELALGRVLVGGPNLAQTGSDFLIA